MTSVNWVTTQDPTLVFGIPVVGYRLPDGSYLENTQLDPDIYVLNAPETIVKGEDTQLKAAVDELLKRQIARYLPHHRSENASKTHPKSSHDKFKTASKKHE